MDYDILKSNLYERIYNNFLENCYLDILLLTKNPDVSFNIIMKTIEKILVFDYYIDNLVNIREKMQKYTLQQIKSYISTHKFEIKNKELSEEDYKIPEKLYLLNFQIHKLFNDLDNSILTNLIVYKKDIKVLSSLLHCSADYILIRYHLILRQIRLIYLEKIKNEVNV